MGTWTAAPAWLRAPTERGPPQQPDPRTPGCAGQPPRPPARSQQPSGPGPSPAWSASPAIERGCLYARGTTGTSTGPASGASGDCPTPSRSVSNPSRDSASGCYAIRRTSTRGSTPTTGPTAPAGATGSPRAAPPHRASARRLPGPERGPSSSLCSPRAGSRSRSGSTLRRGAQASQAPGLGARRPQPAGDPQT